MNDPLKVTGSRLVTRSVAIGDVLVGSSHPLAIQSMTNTYTTDAKASAAQVVALARAGCDIVRLTVPTSADAEALPEIRRIMREEGVDLPLVADIHFSPKLALQVVEHVEKVRINPGNFSDKKRLGSATYDQARWEKDQDRARELFTPLVDRSKALGVAMRIGVNHGSLSDRLVHRYGDTPEGMVASAIEFIEFAEARDYREIVISMKSSIPQVMVQAYRLLASTLRNRGEIYPLHLGVTEAGGGDDGRIKSAAGIATLLGEGIGDTIRVSLTEDPVAEVPVAREIAREFALPVQEQRFAEDIVEPEGRRAGQRRATAPERIGEINFGGAEVPRVEICLPAAERPDLTKLLAAKPPVEVIDLLVDRVEDWQIALEVLESVPAAGPAKAVTVSPAALSGLARDAQLRGRVCTSVDRVALELDPGSDDAAEMAALVDPLPMLAVCAVTGSLGPEQTARIVKFARNLSGQAKGVLATLSGVRPAETVAAYRLLAAALDRAGSRVGLVLSSVEPSGGDPRVGLAGRLAPLLMDGLGVSLRLGGSGVPEETVDLAHRILQASRRRLERTEFIACPSCGRTLFDLESTTEKIREMTDHLKLKIAVMGCVVNGPGEMADADFGFVGWGPGKVALFVGREMVEKEIPFDQAPGRLKELIRAHGRWVDPA